MGEAGRGGDAIDDTQAVLGAEAGDKVLHPGAAKDHCADAIFGLGAPDLCLDLLGGDPAWFFKVQDPDALSAHAESGGGQAASVEITLDRRDGYRRGRRHAEALAKKHRRLKSRWADPRHRDTCGCASFVQTGVVEAGDDHGARPPHARPGQSRRTGRGGRRRHPQVPKSRGENRSR